MLHVKSTVEGEPGTYFSRGVLERFNAMLAVRWEQRKAAMIHHSNLNEVMAEGMDKMACFLMSQKEVTERD